MNMNMNAVNEEANMKESLSIFGDGAGQLIELTLRDADSFVEQIERSVAAGDPKDASTAAHALKSIMRQVGANSVGDIADDIQCRGEANDLEECRTLQKNLSFIYAQTKNTLLRLA